MSIIESPESLGVLGVFEPESEPEFESDHQFFSNVEFGNTSQTSTLKTNRKIIEIDSNQSKNSSNLNKNFRVMQFGQCLLEKIKIFVHRDI